MEPNGPAELPRYAPSSAQVGEWRITDLLDGYMRLDGGAMWGVVPRVFWERWTPPDARHTIPLALRPFLAERGDVRVLIEGGVGDRWSEKLRGIYALQPTTTLEQALAEHGLSPGEITHVLLSHCHWDHCGALVHGTPSELTPRFPNARHFAPRVEIERAASPGHARAASYRRQDIEPLLAAGLLEGVTGSVEPVPGLWLHELGGHSDGVSVITCNELEPGDTAIFWSDVVPTTHHIQPAYMMAFDLDQGRSFEVRSHWLARAARGSWLGLFYHDVEHAFARLVRDGERYRALPGVG